MHIREHVPEWWGVITVEIENDRVDFYILRNAKKNQQVNWKKKMSFLWRRELAHIQELNQMPKYRERSKVFVIDKLLLKVEKQILYQQISEELFERDYTTFVDRS